MTYIFNVKMKTREMTDNIKFIPRLLARPNRSFFLF
jgi:hypothetical protein